MLANFYTYSYFSSFASYHFHQPAEGLLVDSEAVSHWGAGSEVSFLSKLHIDSSY